MLSQPVHGAQLNLLGPHRNDTREASEEITTESTEIARRGRSPLGGKGTATTPEGWSTGEERKGAGKDAAQRSCQGQAKGEAKGESRRSSQSKSKRKSKSEGPGSFSPETARHPVRAHEISLDWLRTEKGLVVEEAKYFHKDCKLAGQVVGTTITDGRVELRMQPTGTTDEGLLKLQSGQPNLELRLVMCPSDCNHEETAEDLVHALRLRKRRPPEREEASINNLEKVAPREDGDELARLRTHMGMDATHGQPPAPPDKDQEVKKKTKKEKAKDKRERKKKSKEKSRRRSISSSEAASGKVALDGSRPRLAAEKTPGAFYKGTGLDPLEKIRNRVAKMARRYVKKKGRKSTSSSASSSSSLKGGRSGEEGDTIFTQAARVRGIAEAYPGVLANQALGQMRSNLLQSWGEEERTAGVPAIAVQYFRQVLQKKATGAVARELLTLCATADLLIKAKPSQALDLVLQRLKSAEATLGGSHWSVSQKLELLPPEQSSLTDAAEMKEAQKVAMEESKTRWMASQPDGRVQSSQKGGGKGKPGGKDDYRRGGNGPKGGKPKGDGKKKEETAAKGG